MKGLKYFILVTQRDYRDDYVEFFKSHGVNNLVEKLCVGTTHYSTLEVMGFTNGEKVMFSFAYRDENIDGFIEDLITKTNIRTPGNGFAAIMPTGGFSESAVKFFVGDRPVVAEENMEKKELKLSLILTIADKGNVETIMDAARSNGAGGGTVIKAFGTGADIAKILGISISKEKEIVYIVVNKEIRNDVMQAIMDKVGSGTDAHGIVFALPVEKVLGIRALENL